MRLFELKSHAIDELRQGLLRLHKFDYDTIDRLMKKIAKKHDITPKKLHNIWVSKYGATPDNWIKRTSGKYH